MRLRVLTFNVQNGPGDLARADLVGAELRRLRPDVVALQEVGYPGERDVLARMLEDTGLHGTHQADVLASVPDFADRFGGTAVASRWPHTVLEAVDQRLPEAPRLPWYALVVSVPVPSVGSLLLIAPTSSWELTAEAARERQAVRLSELDDQYRLDVPTLIAGDLNAAPEASSVRYLCGLQSLAGRGAHYHDAWAVAGDGGQGHTWSADNSRAAEEIEQIVGQPNHRRRIDYVLVGTAMAHPAARARIVSARVVFDQPVGGEWLSDHYGLLVDLDVEATGSTGGP
jgi:endonuclease/exonuclease/phosphatase family metal-dependent hydrolase